MVTYIGLYAVALVFACCVTVAGPTSSAAQEANIRSEVPVLIRGGDSHGDNACSGNGVVVGLDPHGDGFLAVKSGPGLRFARIDKLYNGEQVFLCAETNEWYGVVYTKTNRDCNVMNKIWPTTLPYTGPCRSGWVFKKYIQIFAG